MPYEAAKIKVFVLRFVPEDKTSNSEAQMKVASINCVEIHTLRRLEFSGIE